MSGRAASVPTGLCMSLSHLARFWESGSSSGQLVLLSLWSCVVFMDHPSLGLLSVSGAPLPPDRGNSAPALCTFSSLDPPFLSCPWPSSFLVACFPFCYHARAKLPGEQLPASWEGEFVLTYPRTLGSRALFLSCAQALVTCCPRGDRALPPQALH